MLPRLETEDFDRVQTSLVVDRGGQALSEESVGAPFLLERRLETVWILALQGVMELLLLLYVVEVVEFCSSSSVSFSLPLSSVEDVAGAVEALVVDVVCSVLEDAVAVVESFATSLVSQ